MKKFCVFAIFFALSFILETCNASSEAQENTEHESGHGKVKLASWRWEEYKNIIAEKVPNYLPWGSYH